MTKEELNATIEKLELIRNDENDDVITEAISRLQVLDNERRHLLKAYLECGLRLRKLATEIHKLKNLSE